MAGEKVDMATGGDQGGSIRIPSASCGIVGLKPTYGLVPYTGIMPIEYTLDHTGPMARTVYDTALMLEVSYPIITKLPANLKLLVGLDEVAGILLIS